MRAISLTQGKVALVDNEDYDELNWYRWGAQFHHGRWRVHGGGGKKIRTFMHKRIAEKILRKPLPPKAQVHHCDGDALNNQRSNLVICEDAAYHKLLHKRIDALEACDHADWRKCRYCNKYDNLENLSIERNGKNPYHKKCAAICQADLKHNLSFWRCYE